MAEEEIRDELPDRASPLAEEVEDAYTRKGLQLVVDGTPPELVREILETEDEIKKALPNMQKELPSDISVASCSSELPTKAGRTGPRSRCGCAPTKRSTTPTSWRRTSLPS